MPASKPILRRHFLQIRKDIPAGEATTASIQAANNFSTSINTEKTNIIGIYHPIHSEIDPLPLLSKFKDVTFALPVITGKEQHLLFYPWKLADKLKQSSPYPHLLEPKLQDNPIIPDIIIVPLVAFDTNLHRLGYGGGFYDRTIQQLRRTPIPNHQSPLLVGYAFECQKSPSPLPFHENDMQLDKIITERNIYLKG